MIDIPEFEDQSARRLLGFVADALKQSSRLDARWLIGLACGQDSPVFSHQDICLSPAQKAKLAQLIAQRNAGQPISRMRGKREFWSLDFYLNKATLDPRPDSETMSSAALDYIKRHKIAQHQACFLDLGTGSGCLLLSLLKECAFACGLGIDKAPLAVAQARANAAHLGLAKQAHFQIGNWAEQLKGQFQIILCNPPYISCNADDLSQDVRYYDPEAALFAGPDGLADYRCILPQIGALLADDGYAFFEMGAGQFDAVAQIAKTHMLVPVEARKDLSGHRRIIVLSK